MAEGAAHEEFLRVKEIYGDVHPEPETIADSLAKCLGSVELLQLRLPKPHSFWQPVTVSRPWHQVEKSEKSIRSPLEFRLKQIDFSILAECVIVALK